MRLNRVKAYASIVLAAALVTVACAAGLESGVTTRDFSVRTWGRIEGLPGDSVTTILQTRDGYLWLGVGLKLLRFDGVKFTEVRLPATDSNAPPRVTALCEDAAGQLWIGTQTDGLMRLDAAGSAHFRSGRGLLDNNITALAADTEGRLWVGTQSGLSRWDGKRFEVFTSENGLMDEMVSGLHVARSGAVWITTRSGMYQFKDGRIQPYEFLTESQGRRPEFLGAYEDRRGNLWAFGDTYLINLAEGKRFNYFRGADAAAVRIWSLCEGSDGRLWIGTSGRGLFCFGDNKFQPVTLNELLWPNDVRAIFEDREGNLWLGTGGGRLVQLQPRSVQVLRADQDLPLTPPTSLVAGANGRLYVGFESGGIFVGEGGRFEPLADPSGLAGQSLVASLCLGADETLWLASWGDGLFAHRAGRRLQVSTLNGLADDFVLSVCETADRSIWAGTRSGTLHRISGGQVTASGLTAGLNAGGIGVLLPARTTGLWAGTKNGRLLRGEGERFTAVDFALPTPAALLALYEDAQGRLWVGTSGGGLACWTGQQTLVWTTGNGLPDDWVYGVQEDGDGDLWLATASGISRIGRDALQEALTRATPLRCQVMFESRKAMGAAGDFGWPRAVRSPAGQLWFATPDGLLTVEKGGAEVRRSGPIPVYLESILVNDRPLQLSPARTGAKSNAPAMVELANLGSLDFQFTALSFSAPEKLRFRHRLEGFDPDWVADGTQRRAHYGKLPYGDYRFRVAANTGDGVWNEVGMPFSFTVPTPWWRTPAAIAIYLLTTVGVVGGSVRLVSHRRLRRHLALLEQQQALERERMRIAQDMHDDIGSKLTKLSFLSERVKMESEGNSKFAGQIESIAHTSRELLQTLDEIVWAVNPRNDSLEHLAAYLSHYAAEYFQNTTVRCDIRLPRDLPHYPLSAETRHNLFLSFEEALNNVLKHAQAAQVAVEMSVNPKAFEITITDNGRGYEVPAATATGPATGRRGGNGLFNMRQRLAEVGGECLIRSQRGQGATVNLRIPLNGDNKTKL